LNRSQIFLLPTRALQDIHSVGLRNPTPYSKKTRRSQLNLF
jgi:hypothetical protein